MCILNEESERIIQKFSRKYERKDHSGRSRRGWEGSVNVLLRKGTWCGPDLSVQGQVRVYVRVCMHVRCVPFLINRCSNES